MRKILERPFTHVLLGLGILSLESWTGSLLRFPILFVLPVVLSAWFSNRRMAYALAVLLPAGHALVEGSIQLPGSLSVFAANALIRVAVLGLLAFLVARTARQERELKILHGLLPICMFCKRIRDDREHWHKLETYITGHSEAVFTHSLCPECAREHYGVPFGDTQKAPPAGPPNHSPATPPPRSGMTGASPSAS